MRRGNRITSHSTTSAGFGSFILVDVETSGLNASAHRVLSIAAVALEADGRVSKEFYTLVDPGCDPGPVHIHGLTRQVLAGAPQFEDVREQLSAHLGSKVMVAHNARHDYDFLAEEFSRAGLEFAVPERLCTLALARRVSPPTTDLKLKTLAAYYGVPQVQWHNALDDARVLGGVLRGLMADAARLGVELPMLKCPPKANSSSAWSFPVTRTTPKVPCLYDYPGRLGTDGRLVQGMKVTISGDTVTERAELVRAAESAGLEFTAGVSRRTSVLVTNTHNSATGKAQNAIEYGTPIVNETEFLSMLDLVVPGTRKSDPTPHTTKARPKTAPRPASTGPLVGCRVLVLGGTHDDAAHARSRVAELGGSVSVNMSATVTDVLLLAGGEKDRRLAKANQLGLRVHGLELFDAHSSPATVEPPADSADTTLHEPPIDVLARGQVIDLPVTELGAGWTLRASWMQSGSWEIDLVAFLLDDDEQVCADEDFVFYNQPETTGARLAADGPNEQSVTVALDALPAHCRRIVFAAAIDGGEVTFGDVGAIEFEVTPGAEARVVARSTLDAATEERTLLLAEVYKRGETWRLRSIGQGYTTALSALAQGFGVDVDE